MAHRYHFAAKGQSKIEQFYILTRHIAKVLSAREKRNARCIQCFNLNKGCDGCAEVEVFMRECEELLATEE